MDSNERKIHPVDPAKVKVGDILQFHYWGKLSAVDTTGRLKIENLTDGPDTFMVDGSALVESSATADQYKEEVLLSRTKVAQILATSPNRPLTVAWVKKDGSSRVLRGRLVSTEDSIQGYFKAEDMDIVKTDKEDGLRQVDSRTLRYLIVDGVKYTVK